MKRLNRMGALVSISRRSLLKWPAATCAVSVLGSREGLAHPRVREVDVAVVGAGLSGLSAARMLARAGCSVVVLDARDRVGGRTLNQRTVGNRQVDGGGQWVGGSQTRVMALADELGIPRIAQHETGLRVAHVNGTRVTFEKEVPGAETLHLQAVLENLARQVPLEAPWSAPGAALLDAQSVADWLNANNVGEEARGAVAGTIGTTLSASPENVSLLWFLFYLHSAGGFAELNEGAQQYRLEGGAQALSLRLAEELAGSVVLGAPVRRIKGWCTDSVVIHSDAGLVRARRAIVAMMPRDVQRIDFTPELPRQREALQRYWGASAGFKVHLVFDRPFWRDQGLAGVGFTDSGVVELTFDSTPADGAVGVLLAFVSPTAARLPAAVRRARVIEDVVKLFGEQARAPRDYLEQDWAREAWSAGCVSPLPPGLMSSWGSALKAPTGRIHWAGTETSGVWCGYLDGAIRAGERAAAEVLAQP
ncbi:flavin monoamine oxidase family protein [Myxococcus landrumensis]|uniref:FAD-dependent oxidoreductase n=1 Tax=Myxococcus landrumensis TaxID=2813577 RepID=A0ABX7NGI0_9BACT|nr:FAD-dependent oxidoreductase [Myxococcus landrumus]QSQ17556.1 FAD-dependent oxidoreductase [Myxococcus landrumus]